MKRHRRFLVYILSYGYSIPRQKKGKKEYSKTQVVNLRAESHKQFPLGTISSGCNVFFMIALSFYESIQRFETLSLCMGRFFSSHDEISFLPFFFLSFLLSSFILLLFTAICFRVQTSLNTFFLIVTSIVL